MYSGSPFFLKHAAVRDIYDTIRRDGFGGTFRIPRIPGTARCRGHNGVTSACPGFPGLYTTKQD